MFIFDKAYSISKGSLTSAFRTRNNTLLFVELEKKNKTNSCKHPGMGGGAPRLVSIREIYGFCFLEIPYIYEKQFVETLYIYICT